MTIKALGYIGIAATELPTWREFATDCLGLQIAEESPDQLDLRLDDKFSRISVHREESDGPSYFGWDVGSEAELHECIASLDSMGVPVKEGSEQECAARRVQELIRVCDPGGHDLELFYGQRRGKAFQPSRPMGGFRTDPLGMGHVVFMTTQLEASLEFYGRLGFKLSDRIYMDFVKANAHFLHCNPRHHSLALLPGPADALHHVMLEVDDLLDVGTAYDIVQKKAIEITMTLGQHTNDRMVSFYMRTPAGFEIEYGHGGVLVEDEESWQVAEFDDTSFWGHHGVMRPL